MNRLSDSAKMEMWREHLVTDSTGVAEFIQYSLYRHSDINNELVKQSVEATMCFIKSSVHSN